MSVAAHAELSAARRPAVAFVESYPQVVAGQQRTLMSLLEHWDADVAEPVVITPGGGTYVELLRSLNRTVWELPQPARLGRYGGAVYVDGVLGKLRNYSAAGGYVRMLRRELRRRQVRAVFCNDMRGILTVGVAARSLGLPVMTWDKLDKPHGKLDLIELPLLNRVAVISDAVLTKFPPWQVRRYRNKIERISNGADLVKFDAAAADRSRFGLRDDDIAIGLVGTVCERKGQDRVLAVLPQLLERVPQAVLVIAGSWSDSEDDQRYYATLPHRDHPRVRFLGQRDDIPQLMKSLDLFVLASRHEGMGQVTAEAMACRLPVIGSRAGGIPEVVVHGETGLLFDGDDAEDLLSCLVQLGTNLELRRRMGEAGRRRAEEHFNRPIQMRKVCRLLEALVRA